eukprot:scaffold447_cov307-Pinguiococcus_pyrenoidosus.AAC.9
MERKGPFKSDTTTLGTGFSAFVRSCSRRVRGCTTKQGSSSCVDVWRCAQETTPQTRAALGRFRSEATGCWDVWYDDGAICVKTKEERRKARTSPEEERPSETHLIRAPGLVFWSRNLSYATHTSPSMDHARNIDTHPGQSMTAPVLLQGGIRTPFLRSASYRGSPGDGTSPGPGNRA